MPEMLLTVDLDLGRSGGGFGRIKTTCECLIEYGVPAAQLLGTDTEVLSDMHTWDSSDLQTLQSWLQFLEKFNVFFSWPLDLDMAMLATFPDAYSSVEERGPRGEDQDAAVAVLGRGGPGIAIYKDKLAAYSNLMAQYRYHFVTRSKPATHLAALATVSDTALRKSTPASLSRLLDTIVTQSKVSG